MTNEELEARGWEAVNDTSRMMAVWRHPISGEHESPDVRWIEHFVYPRVRSALEAAAKIVEQCSREHREAKDAAYEIRKMMK